LQITWSAHGPRSVTTTKNEDDLTLDSTYSVFDLQLVVSGTSCMGMAVTSDRIDNRCRAGHASTAKSDKERRIDDILARDGPQIGIRDSCSPEENNIKTPIAANAVFMLARLSVRIINASIMQRT
jgi:hypothetical protein